MNNRSLNHQKIEIVRDVGLIHVDVVARLGRERKSHMEVIKNPNGRNGMAIGQQTKIGKKGNGRMIAMTSSMVSNCCSFGTSLLIGIEFSVSFFSLCGAFASVGFVLPVQMFGCVAGCCILHVASCESAYVIRNFYAAESFGSASISVPIIYGDVESFASSITRS